MTDTFRKTMRLKLTAAAVATVATTAFAGVAHADEPRAVDWIQGLVDLDRIARGDGERPSSIAPSSVHRPASLEDPNPQNLGNAWFGVAPRVTLVARDWASSTRLAGDRLSLVEQMRLSASTRMVVGRARLSEARFTPFFQIGVGQWRVDRNYLPLTPRAIEVAGQLGTGFEMRLTSRWQLAAETTVTSLIRDGQNHSLPQTMLWSTFLASRVEF
ncbi:MAG: hypothetical protein KF764_24615 [Labilithrix sp.]|nr:hypothetical protein [Labilithrix sp.]MBX3221217.1 hypothetical protein [Labilithrix sp.]